MTPSDSLKISNSCLAIALVCCTSLIGLPTEAARTEIHRIPFVC